MPPLMRIKICKSYTQTGLFYFLPTFPYLFCEVLSITKISRHMSRNLHRRWFPCKIWSERRQSTSSTSSHVSPYLNAKKATVQVLFLPRTSRDINSSTQRHFTYICYITLHTWDCMRRVDNLRARISIFYLYWSLLPTWLHLWEQEYFESLLYLKHIFI